jgi:hypothetical protein
MTGWLASAAPTALASSAVMVTPWGLRRLYSASNLSVSMLMLTRNSGTWRHRCTHKQSW